MKVRITERALRDFNKLPRAVQARITPAIQSLGDSPYVSRSKQLRNRHERSMRIGVYRILYIVDTKNKVVSIVGINHRREVHRR